MREYRISGVDAQGKPVSEIIELEPQDALDIMIRDMAADVAPKRFGRYWVFSPSDGKIEFAEISDEDFWLP